MAGKRSYWFLVIGMIIVTNFSGFMQNVMSLFLYKCHFFEMVTA